MDIDMDIDMDIAIWVGMYRYSRFQKVGIWAWDHLCWFFFFSRLRGWRTTIFQLSGFCCILCCTGTSRVPIKEWPLDPRFWDKGYAVGYFGGLGSVRVARPEESE